MSHNGFNCWFPFSESILVNRGWINSRNPKKFKHVEGPVEIIGIVRKNEDRAPFMTKYKPGQNLFTYRYHANMAYMMKKFLVCIEIFYEL